MGFKTFVNLLHAPKSQSGVRKMISKHRFIIDGISTK